MKVFLLLLMIFGISDAAYLNVSTDECNQSINHHRLNICYNYETKTAMYVTYYATGNEVSQKMKRLSFRIDKEIPKQYRATNSDYYKQKNIDKFHLCPDSMMDFNKTTLRDTYYLSNAVPGDSYVNRHRWTLIESAERNFYENHDGYSYSITGVIFTVTGNSNTIGEHKITKPDYFFKCFFNEADHACYIMPNSKELSESNDINDYRVSLDYIQTVTGLIIDFEY